MSFTQTYRGRARYRTFQRYGPQRLVVAVECRLNGLPGSVVALLDTGAEWPLLPTDVARELGFWEEYDEPIEEYSVRGGVLTGFLDEQSGIR